MSIFKSATTSKAFAPQVDLKKFVARLENGKTLSDVQLGFWLNENAMKSSNKWSEFVNNSANPQELVNKQTLHLPYGEFNTVKFWMDSAKVDAHNKAQEEVAEAERNYYRKVYPFVVQKMPYYNQQKNENNFAQLQGDEFGDLFYELSLSGTINKFGALEINNGKVATINWAKFVYLPVKHEGEWKCLELKKSQADKIASAIKTYDTDIRSLLWDIQLTYPPNSPSQQTFVVKPSMEKMSFKACDYDVYNGISEETFSLVVGCGFADEDQEERKRLITKIRNF